MAKPSVHAKIGGSTKNWDRLKKKIAEMRAGEGEGPHAKIGVLATKGAEAHKGTDLTMLEIAAIHEFGSPAAGIPERSYLRSLFKAQKAEISKITQRVAEAILENKISVAKGIAILGQWGVSAVKNQITSGAGIPPPLKPATIKKKGSSRPLVDTGQLLGSITYEVVGVEGDTGDSTEEEGEGEGGGEGGEGGIGEAVEGIIP